LLVAVTPSKTFEYVTKDHVNKIESKKIPDGIVGNSYEYMIKVKKGYPARMTV